MTWKILNAQIREENYYSLVCHKLIPEELKGENFDQHILMESDQGGKNVAITWMDNK